MVDNSEIFQLDKSNYPTREIIKVLGVGGAGNNALNHIVRGGVSGVEFIAVNTDIAHLELSESQNRMVLGRELTKGLGAGSNPEVGYRAAQESRDDIRAAVEGADMVFLAAGMGGGTGTGAAPVIAQVAKEAGSLVIGVVTLPFTFEGKRRIMQGLQGVEELKDKVDALIVIPNDKLLNISDHKTLMNDAFSVADGVLHQAVQGVTDLILRPGIVNVDFADVRTVMSNAGPAIMGIGEGYGDNRARDAANNAINSPLMDTNMNGAKGILVNITGSNVRIHEVNEAINIITKAASDNAYIIWGHVYDPDMEDTIQITVIATGFDHVPNYAAQYEGNFQVMRERKLERKAEEREEVQPIPRFGQDKPMDQRPIYRNMDEPAFSEKVRPVIMHENPDVMEYNEQPLRPIQQEKPISFEEKRETEEQPIPRYNKQPEAFGGATSNLFSSDADSDGYDTPSFLRRKQKQEEK